MKKLLETRSLKDVVGEMKSKAPNEITEFLKHRIQGSAKHSRGLTARYVRKFYKGCQQNKPKRIEDLGKAL